MDLFRRLFSQSEPQSGVTKETSPTKEEGEAVMVTPSTAETQPVELEMGGATRPLPLESVITNRNEHIVFGQSTDVGMVRNNNQDSVLSMFFTSRTADDQPDFGLFIVADGMGGHHDGEKASAMAARVVAAQVTQHIYLPMLTGDPNGDRPPITEALIKAVQKSNSEVIANVPDGGTTLTAATIIGDLAYVVHVGDSRCYLITKDGLEQITRDHSLVQRLKELDQLTDAETTDHPQKNVLYRALGQSEQLEVDAITRRLPPGSRLLLCSDGLWNQMTDNEIRDIAISHNNPQEACDKLVALANTRGGTDNITTILLQVPSS
jgi:PPM family protein phosphatase